MARADAVVKDKDLGWKEIEQQLLLAQKSFVKVGFQQGSKTKNQQKGDRRKKANQSMPEIAASNEFGTSKIPARPFMRTAFDENIKLINKAIQGEYDKIIDGRITTFKSLSAIGELMIRLTQKKIGEITFPPNAPSTIAKKGSFKPLIDFGQMTQSVTKQVVLK